MAVTHRRARPAPGARPPRRLGVYLGIVALLNLVGWGSLLLGGGGRHAGMLGLGVLAFTFGLRHAFDADHISAIDNTTRRLLQEDRPAEGTGFYFSLGHSTVVALLVLALAVAARAVAAHIPGLERVGGVVGTGVSGTFLYLIALLNLAVLADIFRAFRDLRRGELDEAALEARLSSRGLMSRVLGGMLRAIDSAPRMYPVGVLFGLGFDTASEVALLAISAGAASRHLPLYSVMDLPVLFAAGMALTDTLDGAFMCRAYGWAFSSPVRKIYYNLTVTGLSVLVALLVGTVEIVQVVAGGLHWNAGFWGFVQRVDFGTLGYAIVGLFALTWALSYAVWKVGRVEERWR